MRTFLLHPRKKKNIFSCLIERDCKLSQGKKKEHTEIFCLAENVKRSTSKKMNVETDVMLIAMKKAISS